MKILVHDNVHRLSNQSSLILLWKDVLHRIIYCTRDKTPATGGCHTEDRLNSRFYHVSESAHHVLNLLHDFISNHFLLYSGHDVVRLLWGCFKLHFLLLNYFIVADRIITLPNVQNCFPTLLHVNLVSTFFCTSRKTAPRPHPWSQDAFLLQMWGCKWWMQGCWSKDIFGLITGWLKGENIETGFGSDGIFWATFLVWTTICRMVRLYLFRNSYLPVCKALSYW